MYRWPADLASCTRASASNWVGLNRCGSARYSSSVILNCADGRMMGQEASTLASEYGPQWTNMPNLASRYQAVRWSSSVDGDGSPRDDGVPALISGSPFSRALDARNGAAEVTASSFRRVMFINTPFERDLIFNSGELRARSPTPATRGWSQFPISRSQAHLSIPL